MVNERTELLDQLIEELERQQPPHNRCITVGELLVIVKTARQKAADAFDLSEALGAYDE